MSMKDVSDLRQAVGNDEAVKTMLLNNTKVIKFDPSVPTDTSGGLPTPQQLPPIKSSKDLFQTVYAVPDVIVEGLLHRGSKMVLGGGSKSYKTFCLIDLAISVATGTPWWGMPTTNGRVLYINFEIQEGFFFQRIEQIATAKGIGMDENDNLDVWTLRGHCADLSMLMPLIIERVKTRAYDLIIIDPIYKGMGGRDENSAGDINSLLNEIEKLAVNSKAAVVFGAHFSKGNQAGKESIDRISGSGVFARDPDSILVMTKHETEDTYTIDATLRNFKPIDPFCIQWKYPLMERDYDADPTRLKVAGKKVAKYNYHQLLEVLGDQELTTGSWQLATSHKTDMSRRTFLDKLAQIKDDPSILLKTEDGSWKAVNPIIKKADIGAEVQQVHSAPIALDAPGAVKLVQQPAL